MGSWLLKTKDGELELRAEDVLDPLMGKILSVEQPDVDELVLSFCNHLEKHRAMGHTRIIELMHMAFMLGYYYKVFLKKNEVKYESTSSELTGTPSSENDGNSSSN